jgi:hypothetical protein
MFVTIITEVLTPYTSTELHTLYTDTFYLFIGPNTSPNISTGFLSKSLQTKLCNLLMNFQVLLVRDSYMSRLNL